MAGQFVLSVPPYRSGTVIDGQVLFDDVGHPDASNVDGKTLVIQVVPPDPRDVLTPANAVATMVGGVVMIPFQFTPGRDGPMSIEVLDPSALPPQILSRAIQVVPAVAAAQPQQAPPAAPRQAQAQQPAPAAPQVGKLDRILDAVIEIVKGIFAPNPIGGFVAFVMLCMILLCSGIVFSIGKSYADKPAEHAAASADPNTTKHPAGYTPAPAAPAPAPAPAPTQATTSPAPVADPPCRKCRPL